jgi:hypothetical protein
MPHAPLADDVPKDIHRGIHPRINYPAKVAGHHRPAAPSSHLAAAGRQSAWLTRSGSPQRMGSRQRWTIEPYLCLPPAAPRRPRMRRFGGTAAVDPAATAPQRRDHDPIQTWIWAASLRPTGPERLPASRNSALRRADYWHGSASAAGKRSAVAFAQVRRPGPPHQQCGADAGNTQGATQVAPLSRRSTQYCVRKNSMTWEPPYGIEP